MHRPLHERFLLLLLLLLFEFLSLTKTASFLTFSVIFFLLALKLAGYNKLERSTLDSECDQT